MAVAITINGVPTPELNALPGDTVTLANADNTGVTSWSWTLISRPEGSSASLASPNSATTDLTVDVEGSYLVNLTTNVGLGTETSGRGLVGVPLLKTGDRIPAYRETSEGEPGGNGWAAAMDRTLRGLADLRADPGLVVAANGTGGSIDPGAVVRVNGTVTLKSGLPGEERVARAVFCNGSDANAADASLLMCVGSVADGVGGSVANGALGIFRAAGLVADVPNPNGVSTGARLFLRDDGTLDDSPSPNYARTVGIALSLGGGTMLIWFDGGWVPPFPDILGARVREGLEFVAAGAAVATVMRVTNGVGGLAVGTDAGCGPLALRTDGNDRWTIDEANGHLRSDGVTEVLDLPDPTDPTSAARKRYVDRRCGPTLMVFGGVVPAGGSVTYLPPGYGDAEAGAVDVVIPTDLKLVAIHVRTPTTVVDDGITFVVNLNGVRQAPTEVLRTDGGTGGAVVGLNVALAAGDRVSVACEPGGSTSTELRRVAVTLDLRYEETP